MTDYPFGDGLVPDAFDEHTIVFLTRPPDAPHFSEAELDELQAQHLSYLRGLQRDGAILANGPLADPTDARLRGISIYAVPLERAIELARADPMVRAGRLEIHAARWLTAASTARFGRDVP